MPAKILKKLLPVCAFLLLFYFIFLWMYKLSTLPGLHADEAWFGLKAYQYNKYGIGRLYGMNSYTGILQPLVSSWCFKVLGLGVFQLRIPGVFFNLLALIIFSVTFIIHKKQRVLIFFLLILSQSALYLILPRVAWEVNTFTLFFISILTASVINIMSEVKMNKPFWVVLFLAINLLGSYNHIIFSSVSLSALVGIMLWSLYNKTLRLTNVIILLSFNMLNIGLLYMIMRFANNTFIFRVFSIPVLFFVFLIILEIMLFRKLSKLVIARRFIAKINGNLIYIFLGILIFSFLIFHGMGLYDVLSDYKIIMRAYSYQFGAVVNILFLTGGAVICIYLFVFLAEDLKNKNTSLFAFFIISYLGLLSLYTIRSSFRYYLAIYAIIGIYLALKISLQIRRSIPLIISLAGMFILVNISLYKIFNYPNRRLKAIHITIGNNEAESSAHLLPNKPLIDFLKKNKIAHIYYLSDQYFLGEPVLFYELIEPWKQLPGHAAIVGYDYSDNDYGGYLLYRKK